MSSYFDDAIKVILAHEGGLVDDKDDPGGITNFGLTEAFLKDAYPNETIDAHYIESLTKQQAIGIYKQQIWDKYHYDLFNSYVISTKVFDMNVSMGANEAHKLLQRALNTLLYEKIIVNGMLTADDFLLSKKAPEDYLHEELKLQSKNFYENLVKEKPQLNRFLKGWINRAQW